MTEGEATSQEFQNEFMENRATPSIAITSEEDFPSLGDYERKMNLLNSKYSGRGNQGKLMYLAGGEGAKLQLHQFS